MYYVSGKPQIYITYSLWKSYLQQSCHKPFHLKDYFTRSDRLICTVDYCILGIVRGRKLSQITFIDVVCEKTFAGPPILHSPDN